MNHGRRVVGVMALAVTLMCMVPASAMDKVDLDKLQGGFAGIFPRPSEIQGWTVFPVIKRPADPQSLPFELPGQATVTLNDARALYRDKPAGIIETVWASYTVKEMAIWRGTTQQQQVWETHFDVTVREHLSKPELDYARPTNIPADKVIRLGDWAGWVPPVSRDEERLWVCRGLWEVTIKFSLSPGMLREATREPMRALTEYWAGQILNRLVQPPPVKLEITAGPEGTPNPVAPGGQVRCNVEARHGKGLPLTYSWTATGGSFDNPAAKSPTWTAPAGAATDCGITVAISAADGAQVGASYLQRIGSAADLHISPDCIVLSWPTPNTFMEIEEAADKQCVAVQVENAHPTMEAKGVLVQLSAGPRQGKGTHIGNPIPAGDLPPGKHTVVHATWDLQGQSIEDFRLYAHAYCQGVADTNPNDNYAYIDVEGIYYAHNGTRAFSFARDTFSFKNYGIGERGIAALVDKQAALVAGCLDRKQPKRPLIDDPFYMISYLRYQKYMETFGRSHIGGVCHGFVHAAKDHFEDPSTRPIAKDVSALTRDEAGPTVSIYHTTQMLRLGPSMLTNTRFYSKEYGVAKTLAVAETALKARRECVKISLAGYEQNSDGKKVGTWGHALLGFKLIKVQGRDAALYVYDPNRPYASAYIQDQRCMTQFTFGSGGFGMPDNMKMVYHQTNYNADNIRSRTYTDGIAAVPWMRDLSQGEVQATGTAAKATIYAMAHWMKQNGLAGIALRCPADAHFVDAQGRRTGVIGGKVINEIPGAEVRTSDDVEIYFLPNSQQYQVVIAGTDQGQARLASVCGESSTRFSVSSFDSIPLRAGSRAVGTLAPGGHLALLLAESMFLSPQVNGFVDADDPIWGQPGASGGAPATVAAQTLTPVADSYVYAHQWQDWHQRDWGADPQLCAGWYPIGGAKRAYLRFDLPAVAAVQQATLRLYNSSKSGNGAFPLAAYAVNQQWREGTAAFADNRLAGPGVLCWAQQPAIETTPLAIVQPSTPTGWIDLDITTLVNQCLSGQRQNYGVCIRLVNEADRPPDQCDYQFPSRESAQVLFRPQLRLEF